MFSDRRLLLGVAVVSQQVFPPFMKGATKMMFNVIHMSENKYTFGLKLIKDLYWSWE